MTSARKRGWIASIFSLSVIGCGEGPAGATTDGDSTTGPGSTTDASLTSGGDSESGTATGSTGDTEESTTGADTSTTGADTSTTGADTSTTGADTSTTGADTSTTGADTSTTGESTTGEDHLCGDGVVDPGEECDDGNTDNDDVCSALCHVPPKALAFVCGDQTEKCGLDLGAPFYDHCPDGQVLIGFTGQIDGHQWHGNIAGVCGTPAVEVVAGEYAIHVTTAGQLPLRGSASQDGAAWSRLCPEDQMVVGFSGRTTGHIDQLTFACAPLVLAESADGFSFARGEPVDLEAVGNNYGSPFAQALCPPDQVADGVHGRASEDLDKFGLACVIFMLTF